MPSIDIATNFTPIFDITLFSDEDTGLETKAFNVLKLRLGDYIYYPNAGLSDIFTLFLNNNITEEVVEQYIVQYLFQNGIVPDEISVNSDTLGVLTILLVIKGVEIKLEYSTAGGLKYAI